MPCGGVVEVRPCGTTAWVEHRTIGNNEQGDSLAPQETEGGDGMAREVVEE